MGSDRRPGHPASWLIAAVLVAGCAAPAPPAAIETTTTAPPTVTSTTRAPTTTTTGPAAWGERAERYLAAFLDALNAHDLDLTMSYFTRTVLYNDPAAGGVLTGDSAIESFLQTLVDADGFAIEGGPAFLGWRDAVMLVRIHPEPETGGPSHAALLAMRFDGDGMSALEVAYPLPILTDLGVAAAEDVTALEEFYAGYAAVRSSHDADAVGTLYQPTAWSVGEYFGEYLAGSEAIVADAAATFAAVPDLRMAPRTIEPIDGREPGPEIYVAGNGDGSPGSVFAVYDLSGTPCTLPTVLRWSLDERGIAAERWMVEVGPARACMGDQELPAGWWADIVIPSNERVVTATLALPEGDAVLYNASDAQAGLVGWAADRFRTAGLGAPSIAAVTFPPASLCRHGHTGLAIAAGDRYEIALCVTDAELCSGASPCAEPALVAKRAVIHELAHVWTAEHLTEADRAALLRLRGLDAWTGDGVPWEQRGTEHAAEILTWGLMDPAVAVDRLTGASCRELTDAYRMLTGLEPPPGRSGC